jgi:hypothetical protein
MGSLQTPGIQNYQAFLDANSFEYTSHEFIHEAPSHHQQTMIGKLRFHALELRVEAAMRLCESLSRDLEKAASAAERTGIAARFEHAVKQAYELGLLLESLQPQKMHASADLARA